MAGGLAGSNSSVFLYGVNLWDEDVEENYVTFGKSSAVRTVTCLWNDRTTMINNLGGFSGFNLINQFYYQPAVSFPAAPGLMYFSSVKTMGIGVRSQTAYQGGQNMVGYQWCRAKILYESLPWPPQAPGMLSIDYSVESVAMPAPTNATLDPATGAYMATATVPLWKFATTHNFVNAAQIPSRQVVLVNLTWQIFNQLSLPTATLQAYAGSVNNATFLGAAAGQVMFAGAKTNRRMNTQGVEAWDITYPFLYNSVTAGWNGVYNPNTGNFEKIVDQNGNPPFTEMNLSTLVPSLVF